MTEDFPSGRVLLDAMRNLSASPKDRRESDTPVSKRPPLRVSSNSAHRLQIQLVGRRGICLLMPLQGVRNEAGSKGPTSHERFTRASPHDLGYALTQGEYLVFLFSRTAKWPKTCICLPLGVRVLDSLWPRLQQRRLMTYQALRSQDKTLGKSMREKASCIGSSGMFGSGHRHRAYHRSFSALEGTQTMRYCKTNKHTWICMRCSYLD
jgi:hypothetical protein